MNVERLHAIAVALNFELTEVGTPSLLKRLVDGLNEMVTQPQQPQPQQQVSDALAELEEKLVAARSEGFSASWRQTVEELDLGDLFGTGLLDVVREVMRRTELTPSVAAADLSPYLERIQRTQTDLAAMITAFEDFEIPTEDLEPGQVEVSVLIPRGAVRNELPDLGKEFINIQRILNPFVELATGSRPNLEVRAIASSDFGVYLAAVPAAGAALAHAVEKIVSLYKQVLEIRILHQQMRDQGVPDAALAEVESHAESIVSAGIEEQVEVLAQGHEELGERLNELKIELRGAMNSIANRIDAGYNIDVRAEPLLDSEESDEEAEPSPADVANQGYIASIRSAAPSLKFISPAGRPILSLPELPSVADPDDTGIPPLG